MIIRNGVPTYFSPEAKTTFLRMHGTGTAQACHNVCIRELRIPAPDVPGISGRLPILQLEKPLYWRRMTPQTRWDDDPFTVGQDDTDAADNWVAVYRQVTTDECINYECSRESIMIVGLYENRDLAHRIGL